MEDETTSQWHGAWPKIMRMHDCIQGIKRNRGTQDWKAVYFFMEGLYVELYAWAPKRSKKEYDKLWSEFTEQINIYMSDAQKAKGLSSISLKLLLMSMTILKASGLDSAEKIKDDPTQAL